MRVLLLALSACWTSAPPPPEPYWIPPRPVDPPPSQPIACASFAEDDPACATACPRDAPDDWRGCEAVAADLQSKGYVCSNLHSRTCLAPSQLPIPQCPPGGCVPVKSRVIATYVSGAKVVVTLAAGQRQGVSAQWRARFVEIDAAGNTTPVLGGDVTVTRVGPDLTIGTTLLPIAKVHATRFVLLEP